MNAGLAQIFNTSLSFKTLTGGAAGPSLTIPLLPKQIQDEMGEAFDPDYGRMSGFLGVEAPNPQAGLQNMILYGFESPPTEVIDTRLLPKADNVTPISSASDGTQIWKITHNGVDTHPMHFHLYDVQLINRVGWDGIIRKPDLNELGWKDTVRISPLEDTIVALRPVIPNLPWEVTNSIRLINPAMPEGATLVDTTQAELTGRGIMAFDPNGEPIDIINHYVNYGWEYVWHCHILSHEEMDMMRPQVVGAPPLAPDGLTATRVGNGNNRRVDLSWNDNSINETSYTVQRAINSNGPWTTIALMLATDSTGPVTGVRTHTDPIGNTNQTYFYRVQANNVVGDTWDYTDANLNEGAGFPHISIDSAFSNTATFGTVQSPPAAPSNVAATTFRQGGNARVRLTWTDNANNESGFTIQRATDSTFTNGLSTSTVGANTTTWTSGNLPRNTNFYFRIWANNNAGASAQVNASPFPIQTAP